MGAEESMSKLKEPREVSEGFEIDKVVDAKDVRYRGNPGASTKYDEVLGRLRRMTDDKVLVVRVSHGSDLRMARARMSSSLRYKTQDEPFRVFVKITDDGKLAISRQTNRAGAARDKKTA